MMMQMLSAGAMGGGISSAHRPGARRWTARADADALVLHAIVVNLLLGLTFSIPSSSLAFGRSAVRRARRRGRSVEAALLYSNVVFAGFVGLVWLMNVLGGQ